MGNACSGRVPKKKPDVRHPLACLNSVCVCETSTRYRREFGLHTHWPGRLTSRNMAHHLLQRLGGWLSSKEKERFPGQDFHVLDVVCDFKNIGLLLSLFIFLLLVAHIYFCYMAAAQATWPALSIASAVSTFNCIWRQEQKAIESCSVADSSTARNAQRSSHLNKLSYYKHLVFEKPGKDLQEGKVKFISLIETFRSDKCLNESCIKQHLQNFNLGCARHGSFLQVIPLRLKRFEKK